MSSAPLPGGRLAYGRFSPDGSEVHIFMVETDGTDEKPLLAAVAEQPRWSPDGRPAVPLVAESPEGLIFVGLVNPDGSNYVQFHSPHPTLNSSGLVPRVVARCVEAGV